MTQPTLPIISEEAYDLAKTMAPGSVFKVSDGNWRISASVIPSPAASGYGSSSRSSPATYYYYSVPTTLESTASLERCGYDVLTASKIFNDWSTDPDLLSVEHHIIKYLHDAYYEYGDWRVNMNKIGISRHFQDRIMTPGHDFIQSFHSLRYLLEEFLVSNFLSLQTLDKRINSFSQPGHMRGEGFNDLQGDFYSTGSANVAPYRIITAARLQDVFLPNDTHDLSNTNSQPARAHDFGHIGKGAFYCYTCQEWVVQLYASHSTECINERDVCVLNIMSKESEIAPLGTRTWRIDGGDEWRELVWHSRKEIAFPETIRDKHKLTRTSIGPIYVDTNEQLTAKKSYKDITKADVARKDNLPEGYLGMQ